MNRSRHPLPLIFFILWALLFAFAPFSSASAGNSREIAKERSRLFYNNSWAVVIGIDRYRNWPRLESAVNDAESMAARLEDLGFNVVKIINKSATRAAIAKELGYRLPRKVGKKDRVLIFFAGHGQTEETFDKGHLGYIIPVDADTNDLTTAISMDELRIYSRRINAKHLLYVMDSCYSGLGITRSQGLSTSVEDYVEKITKRSARQMITAGGKGEQVAESEGHGIFTKLILQGLAGSADIHQDGVITASELSSYIQPKVAQASGNLQTPRYGRLPGDDDGEFVFILDTYFRARVSELREKEALQHQIEMEKLKRFKAQEEAERIKAESDLVKVREESGGEVIGSSPASTTPGTAPGSPPEGKVENGSSWWPLAVGGLAVIGGAAALGGGGGDGGDGGGVSVEGQWHVEHRSSHVCTGTINFVSGGSVTSAQTCDRGLSFETTGTWSYSEPNLTYRHTWWSGTDGTGSVNIVYNGVVSSSQGTFVMHRENSSATETISR